MTSALRRLLDEPKFVAQVARFAAMWRGMGREGFSEAVYWLELLIQYGHLDHLRINDGDLNFVQYFCLDVLALYLVLVMALFAVVADFGTKYALYMVFRFTKSGAKKNFFFFFGFKFFSSFLV